MMPATSIYSVWNLGKRLYDYYSVGAHLGTHITQPSSHSLVGSSLGLTPDEFAARVPSNAVKVGSGPVAQGQVASFGESGVARTWIIYGVLAYVAWRMFR